jgi:hypothetical protein
LLLRDIKLTLPEILHMLPDPQKLIEEIAYKKIFHKYPAAIAYKAMIIFTHTGNKASMNLDLLPLELVKKIEEMF